VVTLLSKGHLLAGSGGCVVVAAERTGCEPAQVVENWLCAAADYRVSPSRAPPSSLPLLKVVG
jgi:hypothetical protein